MYYSYNDTVTNYDYIVVSSTKCLFLLDLTSFILYIASRMYMEMHLYIFAIVFASGDFILLTFYRLEFYVKFNFSRNSKVI